MNAPTDAQKLIAEMDGALHTMLDENEVLRAERDHLRAEVKRLVDWVMGDRDALHCLQSIYNSPHADQGTRIKAAAAAIAFERPKLTFTPMFTLASFLIELALAIS